ncbi:MAG: PrsW family intramembrane metalloprotease [Chloroflexi bacterium]|nr:PrsW family intramembrane metalloprotease [Chloroflexota bacterium]
MILAAIVAIAIPLVFLFIVRWLDLYASGSFKVLLICLGSGVAAFFLALAINTFVGAIIGFSLLVVVAAPIIEEILKSLVLIYLVRRPSFTYFVDGAIYGFAAGTAFAVLENLLYLGRASAGEALFLILGRALSTSLMHGSASALVGIALGRLRYGRGPTRILSLVLGWAAAMLLHIFFNNALTALPGSLSVMAAVLLGLGGVGIVAAFIFWGLRQERRWLKEILGLGVGVSAQESAVVQQMAELEVLLAPVGQRFGEEKRKQVEAFLKLQAQLGIKRKAQEMTREEKPRRELADQVAALRTEMDGLRRQVGVYCMSYVRSILPPETEPIWLRLGATLAGKETTTGPSLWIAIGEKIDKEKGQKSEVRSQEAEASRREGDGQGGF